MARDRKNQVHRKMGTALVKRVLLPTEDVHHKDGNKSNNALSNLEVLPHGAHSKLTSSPAARKARKNAQLSTKKVY